MQLLVYNDENSFAVRISISIAHIAAIRVDAVTISIIMTDMKIQRYTMVRAFDCNTATKTTKVTDILEKEHRLPSISFRIVMKVWRFVRPPTVVC